jgi:2-polyprenyl-3-methyl-5-hydroxy-6-metoxy-1,4-benzoquinol methylase
MNTENLRMANIEKLSAEKIYVNAGNPDVLSLLGPEDRRILDIGCGNGANASLLTSRGCVVDGISISEQELATARPYLQQSFLHNLEEGLPDLGEGVYDAVICSHVLEHIGYPDKLLNDIRRVLKKGGHLIVALPNLLYYKSRLELLKGNFKYEETGIWDYTHLRWYTFASGRQMLEDKGFVIDVATVTGELPLNSLWKKVLPAPVRSKLFNGLKKLSKGLFGYQLLYKVRSDS